MTHASSANIFTGLTAGVSAFQPARVVGAPQGVLTLGGLTTGTLPPGARAGAPLRYLLPDRGRSC